MKNHYQYYEINFLFKTILDLQKNCEDGTESSQIPCSLIINILH